MHFTDTAIKALPLTDKAAWHSDPRFPGLRLQTTKSKKTWHGSKWDSAANKARTRKLGTYTPNQNLGWARKQLADFIQEVEEGRAITTRKEQQEAELEAARNRPPTLIECMDAFLEYRSHDRGDDKKMSKPTAKKYRQAILNHLSEWKDTPIDELPAPRIRAHLDTLQAKQAHAAMYASNAMGCAIRHFNRANYANLLVPGLTKATKPGQAEVNRDVTLYPQRWAEIEAKGDPVEVAMWKVRWLSGIRVEALRALKWSDIDFKFRTVSIGPDKKHPARVIPLADVLFDLLDGLDRRGEYVFASRVPGRVVQLRSRGGINVARHMRHLYHDASLACFVHDIVHGMLAGQKVATIRGHYSRTPDMDTMRDAANKIAGWILARAKPEEGKVVDLNRTTA